jgi:hypothetical protein
MSYGYLPLYFFLHNVRRWVEEQMGYEGDEDEKA